MSAPLPGPCSIGLTHDSSATNATFEILNEDHTLGNALRYAVNKNPKVEFAGYSIPHPLENKMNFHIQCSSSTTALKVMDKAATDVISICEHIDDCFDAAIEEKPLERA